MKKRKILSLFPLIGLLLTGCDVQEALSQFGSFENVIGTITGKEKEEEKENTEEQKEEENTGEHEEEEDKVFTGLSFENETVVYDGKTHKLEVSGELPEGATVDYGSKGNEFSTLGEHYVVAVISCEGYETLMLTAKMTIVEAIFAGIQLNDKTVTYDGNEQKIELEGTLPEGATVSYGENGNTFVQPGDYEITATISCYGYQDLVLTATLKIVAGDLEGIRFEDATVIYDGEMHEIAPIIPEQYAGARISYSEGGNQFKAVGEHEITAFVSYSGYNTWIGSATLTILPADFEGLSLEDKLVSFDGEFHTIELTGMLPEGAIFSYVEGFEGGTDPGQYEVKGLVQAEGFNDLALSATLTITAEQASESLVVADFEGYTDNDLVDNFKLEYYSESGWITPSAATISVANNQEIGEGAKSMNMSITHQGRAFKVTKDLDNKTYKKYSGFAIDTMMEDFAEGGTMKVQVQFWFKDLPLPEAYSDYKNTYATYTLANACPSTWTHWEIPFTDSTLSIASGYVPVEALSALELTMEELSIYIDQVAVIATPNYVNGGPSCHAYIDNIELGLYSERMSEEVAYGGRYGALIEDEIYALEINSAFTTAKVLKGEEQLLGLNIAKEHNSLIFKDDASDGAALTINAELESGKIKVKSLSGLYAESFAALSDLTLVKLAHLNYDLEDKTSQVGDKLNDSHWKQEKWDNSWLTTSGQMNVRESGGNTFCNMVTGYYMDYRYTFQDNEILGLANKFSVDIANDFSGCENINAKIRIVTTSGREIFTLGSATEYVTIPAGTAKWMHIEAKDFGEVEVKAIIFTVKSTVGKTDYLYFDNLKLEYAVEEPVVYEEINDGLYGFVLGENLYALELSEDVTKASFLVNKEVKATFTAEMAEGKVTLKDTAAAGAGLTITLSIESGTLVVEDLKGQLAETYMALKGQLAVELSNFNYNLTEFASLAGNKLNDSHWVSQKYTDKWVDVTPPNMNVRKVDSTGNIYCNMYAGWKTTFTYKYTPDKPFATANHFSVDLINDFKGDVMNVKVKLIKADNSEHYLVGSSSAFAQIPTIGSRAEDRWETFEFDFDAITGVKAIQFAIKNSGDYDDYIYFDNLKLDFKGPEQTPVEPPVEFKTIEDGLYYIWNGNNDAFKMNIANSLTTATVSKLGGDSYEMTVSVDGETVTFKDAGYAGAGLTIVASIIDDNEMQITSVTGAMADALSGSLLNKPVRHCADVNLGFEDGVDGNTYTNSHWTESHYTSSGWTDYGTPTQMRAKKDKNGGKIVNFAASTTAYNFLYSPDVKIGPVNHAEVDLGHYHSSSTASEIRYKISLIGSDGNVARYIAGDASNWATIAKDTSEGNICKTLEFDFAVAVGYKLRVTVSTASGSGYLYMDNLKVFYKA